MDKYPVYIGNEEKGSLAVYPDGLMTCFEAECESTAEIIRLNVYGSDGEAYLGTLTPAGDKLCLKRKFSRAQLRSMPQKILYAADNRLASDAADDGITWYESNGGVLTAYDGGNTLTALPLGGGAFPEDKIRRINGRDYVIFSR